MSATVVDGKSYLLFACVFIFFNLDQLLIQMEACRTDFCDPCLTVEHVAGAKWPHVFDIAF